jgi:hypothetical protein
MSAANSRSHAMAASRASSDSQSLFKEDRPRRIDRVISFFGDTEGDGSDQPFEMARSDRWSE